MGRLKNTVRQEECIALLREYGKKELKRYKMLPDDESREKRELAFLISGINVSLVYGGDREALDFYLCKMSLENPTCEAYSD